MRSLGQQPFNPNRAAGYLKWRTSTTKRQLHRITVMVMFIYGMAVALGIFLRAFDHIANGALYTTYKDLLPLIIAIPAAYLAYSFQRRASYVRALRALWSGLIAAVQAARSYTDLESASQERYAQTLSSISVVIEEARGVFCNIPAPNSPSGWYPFEPIKEIHADLTKLGFGNSATPDARGKVRERIDQRWKLVRAELLREFDRDVPTYHYAWYTNMSHSPEHRETDEKTPASGDGV